MYKQLRQENPKRYLDYDNVIDENGILVALSLYNHDMTHEIPSVHVQNSILRHVLKVNRENFINKHGIFFTNNCMDCEEKMFLYMHSNNNNSCASCARVKLINKIRCPTFYNDTIALSKLKKKIYSVDVPGYDHDKNYNKCENAVKKRNFGLISLYSKYPCSKFKCTLCGTYKFINEYHTEMKSKKGIQTKCNQCNKLDGDCLIYKINNLITRAKKHNIPVEQSMTVVEMINNINDRQKGLDYYTMIPLEYVSGSPFSPSPEKIDRDGGYLLNNTALCFQILNVGGEKNWSRRLTLQIYFAELFNPLEVVDINNNKLKEMWNNTKKNAIIRGKKKRRKDNSGQHTLTLEQCIELYNEQLYRCALSKLPLVFKKHHPWMASIDRVDPSEGYHKWNCRIIIYRLNMGITWNDTTWSYFHTQLKVNIELVINVEGIAYDVLPDNTFKLLDHTFLDEQNLMS